MPERKTITVSGMSCTGCEDNVERALRSVPGVRRADATHDDESVEVVVEDEISDERIGDAIHNAGYEFVG